MNPSTETAFETFEGANIELSPRKRRLAQAPARDYTPEPVVESEPVPEVPPGLLQCEGVPYAKHIKSELKTIAPELPELTRLAERERRLLEAAEEFSDPKARDDHEAESRALRGDPSPANIAKLKAIGSIEERRASYAVQYRGLHAEADKIAREAMPLVKAIGERLSRRLGELSREAIAEELAVFRKWGITEPPSRIGDHFMRVRQELKIHSDHFERGHFSGTISGWLRRFLTA
jgi:hypothetical protein